VLLLFWQTHGLRTSWSSVISGGVLWHRHHMVQAQLVGAQGTEAFGQIVADGEHRRKKHSSHALQS